jgi:hypothetical protein
MKIEELNNILNNSIVSKLTNIYVSETDVFEMNTFEMNTLDMNSYHSTIKLDTESVQLQKLTFSSNYINKFRPKFKNKIEVDSVTINKLTKEAIQFINKNFISHLDVLSTKTYLKSFNSIDKILNIIYSLFKKKYNKTYKIKNEKEVISRILYETNKIAGDGRVGLGDFVICSVGSIDRIFNNSDYIVAAKMKKMTGSIYEVGRICNVDVYVDTDMKYNDHTIYVGKRTTEDYYPGIHFAYKPDEGNITILSGTSPTDNTTVILKLNCAIFIAGSQPENQYTKFIWKEKKSLFDIFKS